MVIEEVRSQSVAEWQYGIKGEGLASREVRSMDLDCEDEMQGRLSSIHVLAAHY